MPLIHTDKLKLQPCGFQAIPFMFLLLAHMVFQGSGISFGEFYEVEKLHNSLQDVVYKMVVYRINQWAL